MDRIFVFPVADSSTYFVVVAIALGMFGCAVGAEIWRRRRDRRLRIAAEWRSVDNIIEERQLSDSEAKLLKSLLAQYAPESPLHAATVRHAFDECVVRDLATLPDDDETGRTKRGVALRDLRVRLALDYVPFGQRIQSTREFYTGQVIWIRTGAERKRWQRLSVVGIDEAYFYAAPKADESLPNLPAKEPCDVRMWREEDGRYAFSAIVQGVVDAPPALKLRHATELHRTQSRAYFRIKFEAATDLQVLSASPDGDLSDLDDRPVVARLRGRFTSLSGGGFAMLIEQLIPKQVVLRLDVPLRDEDVPVTARVIDCEQIRGGACLLRAAFVQIPEETREKITHYVFARQQAVQSESTEIDSVRG